MVEILHPNEMALWAEFCRSTPQEIWRPILNEYINAQFDIAHKFRENLSKTEEGKRFLAQLVEMRKNPRQ